MPNPTKNKPIIHTDTFPRTPAENDMRGATVLRLVFRKEPPVHGKPFDDPANAPSEELTLACKIAGRWGTPTKGGDGRLGLPQEIFEVDGWGFSNIMHGPVQITLNPKKKSQGMTVEKIAGKPFPAESHFDMYIRVSLPHNPDMPVLENTEPIRITSSDVRRLPPLGSPFVHNGHPIALKDSSGTVHAWAFQGKKNLVQLVKQTLKR